MDAADTKKTEQGQALVEFALTVPIFLMFVFGIIDLARILYVYTQAINSARQGVRYGMVTGLQKGQLQYLDCTGIDNAARRLPGLFNLTDATVNIYYENAKGDLLTNCVDGLDAWDVGDGDVLAVRVAGTIHPLTPIFAAFTHNITFGYTSRRTIVAKGTAYTATWQESPPSVTGFTAQADCSTGLVDFYWNAMSPQPTRMEIRSTITGAVVANPDPSKAYCYDCATIPTQNGLGGYYIVAYNGTPPSELAGPPSGEQWTPCGSLKNPTAVTPPTKPSVAGTIFRDKDGNKVIGNGENGISSVKVNLIGAGADGTLYTADDLTYRTTTDKNGYFYFPNLTAGKYYTVKLVYANLAVGSNPLLLTTDNEPLQLYFPGDGTIRVYQLDGLTYSTLTLADGLTYSSANFGFN